jgi:hypothetical protein
VTTRLIVALLLTSALARGAAVDLHGQVIDDKGAGVAGATVYVYGVWQSIWENQLAANYFPDWGKKALTDSQGKFVVEKMDGQLKFAVLVVGDGFEVKRFEKADPTKELKVKLVKVKAQKVEEGRFIKGVVKDGDGKAVWGAEVVPFGFQAGKDRWWPATGVPVAATVTAQKGEFVYWITKQEGSKNVPEQVDIRVNARGFASTNTLLLSPGEDAKEFTLGAGATIVGRLVHEGKGVANAVISAQQEEMRVERFIGYFNTRTDEEGSFKIEHVKGGEKYVVRATMASVGERGAMPVQTVSAPGEGESVDLGEVSLAPAHVVAGRLKMSDGKKVKEGTMVTLSLDVGTDRMVAKTDGEGKFRFAGVPTGGVWLDLNVNGYRPSKENASYESVNGTSLLGLVEEDMTDLVVLIEPGKPTHEPEGDQETLKSKRLEGVKEN